MLEILSAYISLFPSQSLTLIEKKQTLKICDNFYNLTKLYPIELSLRNLWNLSIKSFTVSQKF